MGLFSALFGNKDQAQLSATVSKDAFLVDVRTPGEFASGTVPGAVNIPLDTLPTQLAKFNGKKTIVVFCRSGNRSAQAKNILVQNGFKNVINGGTWKDVNAIVKG